MDRESISMPFKPFPLNLPIVERASSCRNLLIAGMGGGFDIFCGLPLYFELKHRGINVHLANYSFSEIKYLKGTTFLTDTLVGVQAKNISRLPYFPELHLSRWFQEIRGEEVTLWAFEKTGLIPLVKNYRVLVERLNIDGILLMDGGVDSLIKGDEAQTGTPVEDALSLLAVHKLDTIPTRLLACLGFGAEDSLSHAHVLQNIANLSEEGSFLGTCSLLPQMEVYQAYKDAVNYVHAHSPPDTSVINSSIISAVDGRFGNYHATAKTKGSRLWISPLMSMYWFFELEAVARKNLLFEAIDDTLTFQDALRATLYARQKIKTRGSATIPLS